MPFIPHTEEDIQAMLATCGVSDIDALFDEVPAGLKNSFALRIPEPMTELERTKFMNTKASETQILQCFAGAGAYDHHIPAAVWELTTRGEFYSAYTPYQAEASQGTLQLIYEYQTMISGLNALEVSNASLYDGATALAEAVLMAIRANRKSKSKNILMPTTVHPIYRKVVKTIVSGQAVNIIEIPFDEVSGTVKLDALKDYAGTDIAALVIPQPNYFGNLEDVDALTDWAHAQNALAIAVVNPMSLSVLTPPGEWGDAGADIACGEGQPLGIPMSGGGPYFGFMCAKQAYVRQMPGRIVGQTVDKDGQVGFALTLQAREQHIRRSKATSNICTNQGLMVTAATIYMSIMGFSGLQRVGSASANNLNYLRQQLEKLNSVSVKYAASAQFHELAVELPIPAQQCIDMLAEQGILAGVNVGANYEGMENTLLVCVTETKSLADIDAYIQSLSVVLQQQSAA